MISKIFLLSLVRLQILFKGGYMYMKCIIKINFSSLDPIAHWLTSIRPAWMISAINHLYLC